MALYQVYLALMAPGARELTAALLHSYYYLEQVIKESSGSQTHALRLYHVVVEYGSS